MINPTQTEMHIRRHTRPARTRGLVRNAAFVFRDAVDWSDWYRSPDPNVPKDYESKLLAGCRGEWFASVVHGKRRVLDLGCGFGFPSFYLSRYDHDVVGVDTSPTELETARQVHSRMGHPQNVTFRLLEGRTLPFEDHSFDAATLGSSLECMEDPAFVLQELLRVLKPDSPIAIEEEDRSREPSTHPVWEKCRLAFFQEEIWLWYELRVHDPHLDRRYMLKLDRRAECVRNLCATERKVLDRSEGLPVVSFEETGLKLGTVLSNVVDGEYAEIGGFLPTTLRSLLLDVGFTDVLHFLLPDGRRFAESLQGFGLLPRMPVDVRAVLRALVASVPPVADPISAFIAARTPAK